MLLRPVEQSSRPTIVARSWTGVFRSIQPPAAHKTERPRKPGPFLFANSQSRTVASHCAALWWFFAYPLWAGTTRPPPSPQLHPVVVPQSSQTMQCPLTFIRIELQLLHWSPV